MEEMLDNERWIRIGNQSIHLRKIVGEFSL